MERKTKRTLPHYWRQVWNLASLASLVSLALVTMVTYVYMVEFKADVLDTSLCGHIQTYNVWIVCIYIHIHIPYKAKPKIYIAQIGGWYVLNF
jgi:hypothetical protein